MTRQNSPNPISNLFKIKKWTNVQTALSESDSKFCTFKSLFFSLIIDISCFSVDFAN